MTGAKASRLGETPLLYGFHGSCPEPANLSNGL